jgi:hypothetical protein
MMEINAKFERLPEGYSYELYPTGTCSGGYKSYGVEIINSQGIKTALIGKEGKPCGFACEPQKIYDIKDVRNSLVKSSLNNEVAYHYHLHGCGERTKKYLDACKSNLSLLRSDGGEDLTIDKTWEKFADGYVGSEDFFRKETNGGWVAGFAVQYDIDGVYEHRYYFSKRPSRKDILTAKLIDDIKMKFSFGDLQETFNCWECGKETHWLDVGGNLEEKFDKLKDKYCGC